MITRLIKAIGVREWFIILIMIVFITDLTIFLDIPFLRQVLAFLCFTTIPGLLVLQILKLNKIEFLKKFVLSIGLSIAFLMFAGLSINQLCLAIRVSKPLSTSSLVISFTFILVILSFIAYKRNKDDFNLSDFFNVKIDIKGNQLISLLFFPIIFPFLAVLGSYFMNTEENNIILMIMLFLIPIYVAIIVYLRNRIPKITYSIAIWMISLSLLLMHGLTSHYIIGRDVHCEYYCFRIVADNLYWSMSNYRSLETSCLSISILPTIYKSLLNINGQYIYKLVYQLIFSITPLVAYILFKKYVNEVYAFLSSIFFMAQIGFIYAMPSAIRQEIAIFSFVFVAIVFFDDEIDNLNKKILFIIFMFSVIVSHYSTTYIFFFMILLFWLITVPLKNLFANFNSSWENRKSTQDISINSDRKQVSVPDPLHLKSKTISAVTVTLFFALLFFWYSQATEVAFNSGVRFVKGTLDAMSSAFFEESQHNLIIIGKGAEILPDKILVIIHDIAFFLIAIGCFNLIVRYKKHKDTRFEKEYVLLMSMSIGLLLSMAILPHVSVGYSIERTYIQLLVFLAPAFVIGGETIAKYILRRPQLSLMVITIVLISQFFGATLMVHQFLGDPYSEDLNRNGPRSDELIIYDQEVIGAKWVGNHNTDELTIYTDTAALTRLQLGYSVDQIKRARFSSDFFKNNKTIAKGYIYLRYNNIVRGIIRNTYQNRDMKNIRNIKEYSHLFAGKSKIYSNGGSEVWR